MEAEEVLTVAAAVPPEVSIARGANETVATVRQCRYCLGTAAEDAGADFVAPCGCTGGQQWVHLECLRRWQRSVLLMQPTHPSLQKKDERGTHCGVCTQRFRYAPPSRHEMMMSFTGVELAALVQEQTLICASEEFSAALRVQLKLAAGTRRNILNFVHWCFGAYFIFYAGPKHLALSIPNEENREAVKASLDETGLLRYQGRRYRILPEGPLAGLAAGASLLQTRPVPGPAVDNVAAAASSSSDELSERPLGAAWVQRAMLKHSVSASETSDSDMGKKKSLRQQTLEAFDALALPVELSLELADDGEEKNPGSDTIRAFNLGNRIRTTGLSEEAKAVVRQALRRTGLPPRILETLGVQHHLGGPCAQSQCLVLLPLGGVDGAALPVPAGFKVFPRLNVAVGSDLAVALRALADVRGRGSGSAPPPKRRRADAGDAGSAARSVMDGMESMDRPTPSCSSTARVLHVAPSSCKPSQTSGGATSDDSADELEASEGLDADADDAMSDSSDVNAAELVASGSEAPSDSGDESLERAVATPPPPDQHAGGGLPTIFACVDEVDPPATESDGLRPLQVFWGEARWQRTQLLGELARGDWGLCQSLEKDVCGDAALWQRVVCQENRLIRVQPSEKPEEGMPEAPLLQRLLRSVIAAHREASRQQAANDDDIGSHRHAANSDDADGAGAARGSPSRAAAATLEARV